MPEVPEVGLGWLDRKLQTRSVFCKENQQLQEYILLGHFYSWPMQTCPVLLFDSKSSVVKKVWKKYIHKSERQWLMKLKNAI